MCIRDRAYIEIPKKQGKSELAAAVALLLTCGDGEERAEVYGCAADRVDVVLGDLHDFSVRPAIHGIVTLSLIHI